MAVSVEQQFDCTQRELILDIAAAIYATHGGKLPEDPLTLWDSQHPTERAILIAAENIFEMFWGDSPDYSDEP